jgi:WD40 repeat protein
MTGDDTTRPPSAEWVAAIHSSEVDFAPIGTAVVIDERRVLTCAHVVTTSERVVRQPLWVAFPKSDEVSGQRRRVTSATVIYNPPVEDVAVLLLEDDVPTGIVAAPLRCPRPQDLVGRKWWAFGFTRGDPVGNSADGSIGESLGYGWVRLDVASRYQVEVGFSGAGLWSPDYQAVVAIVGQAHADGDGRAITMHRVDLSLPGEKLHALAKWSPEAAGELALSAWGWALGRDPEARRHWRPRARGVSIDSERGYRFRGRMAALQAIVDWLDRQEPDRRTLVITGSPGVGKSAVLGRIVTTADAAVRAALPLDDDAITATVGSIGCAVHVKGKTSLEVATEVARGASARLPDHVDDTALALRDSMTERGGMRFNLVIDALDEAASPADARAIITGIVLPLVETCGDVGAQVVVGTRRSDEGGDLVRLFGNAAVIIDLDDHQYFAEADLVAYAMASLQLTGDERSGNPYADSAIASALANRIAEIADRNFLVAGLVARAHGLHDQQPIAPEQLAYTTTVDSALVAYLERVGPITDITARDALTALAFAEAPGLPIDLWRLAIGALSGDQVTADQISRFARSSAANFLVESGTADRSAVFRLFHQALNDALLAQRSQIVSRQDDELAISQAFIRFGRQNTWGRAPVYLLRSLAAHAANADIIDDLLTDDTYLLYADLRRLIPLADQAASPAARDRVRLLHLTPLAITADPQDRAALFSVTQALENLGDSFAGVLDTAPYYARWASVRPRTERAILGGHGGWVRGVCAFTLGGQVLLASASNDHTVRTWDSATGEQQAVLEGHTDGVRGVCVFTLKGQVLLASAGADTTLRIWDPATGEQRSVLEGHPGAVSGVCAFTLGDRVLLASVGTDATVRIWDPATGEQQAVLEGHAGWVSGVCAFTLEGRVLLASAGADATVRIWDPAAGHQQSVLEGHANGVNEVCAFILNDRVMLASASDDMTIRIFDAATGEQQAVLEGHADGVRGICVLTFGGRVLLASGGADRTVRIWDPGTGQQRFILEGHNGWLNSVCSFMLHDQVLLASASDDRTVRIFYPAAAEQRTALAGHAGGVNGVCAFTLCDQILLASAGADATVRIWGAATGRQEAAFEGHAGGVNGVCAFTLCDQILLASAGADATVRIWDPATRDQQAALAGHAGGVNGVCAFTLCDQILLASAGADATVRIWDPATRDQQATLTGHTGWVSSVCAFTLRDQILLASAGADATVRIWNPETEMCLLAVPVHHAVQTVCQACDSLVLGLTAGILAVDLQLT